MKKSHSACTEPHALPEAEVPRHSEASSTSPNSRDCLSLSMLCAMARKTMSASQRLLLIQLLVQSFVAYIRYVPLDAQRILVATDLPPVLERVAARVQAGRQAWFAWTDNRRIWFLVAEMATDCDQGSHTAALRISFYDEEGECVATGTWAFHSDGKWTLLAL